MGNIFLRLLATCGACPVEPVFLSLQILADQVVCHHILDGQTLETKLYPLTGKLTRTLLCPIVNQIIAINKVFAMRQDNTFLEEVAKVIVEPLDFAPCRKIVSRAVEKI
jgi:hypothetical protein